MREIKFRAWDKTREEYLSSGQMFISIESGINPHRSITYLDLLKFPDLYKDRFIIEQFISRRDRNGVEIYEGDIVNVSDGDDSSFVEVAWNDRISGFGPQDIFWGCTVIGNIHENPELLK